MKCGVTEINVWSLKLKNGLMKVSTLLGVLGSRVHRFMGEPGLRMRRSVCRSEL